MTGLADALRLFADEAGRGSGVRFHLDVEVAHLPGAMALLVYHIAREGVKNSLQHARATDIWVTVREEHGSIVLEVRDNGVGFDPPTPGPEGRFGVEMMSDRAQVGGGTFEMRGAPGEGTKVRASFPTSIFGPG